MKTQSKHVRMAKDDVVFVDMDGSSWFTTLELYYIGLVDGKPMFYAMQYNVQDDNHMDEFVNGYLRMIDEDTEEEDRRLGPVEIQVNNNVGDGTVEVEVSVKQPPNTSIKFETDFRSIHWR